MKILLTNNHLHRYGGSETFTYTMAKELSRRGHDVTVMTFQKGATSKKIEEFAPVVSEPDKGGYDLILVNHNTCFEKVKNIPGFKIFTSHGVYMMLEVPVPGADAYVAISEEVQQGMKARGFEATLIRNGVDCERFRPMTPILKEPVSVLSMCQGGEAQTFVKKACEELGLKFNTVRFDTTPTFDVETKINEADIVFSLGRGAYEALACGRVVIVYDTRDYSPLKTADGMVTSENATEIIKNNFSGRRFKKVWTVEDVKAEIKKYDSSLGSFSRSFAVENFDIVSQVDKYLGLMKSYGREEWLKDREDPTMPHIKDKKRFKNFYEELGKDPIQETQYYRPWMDFIKPKGKILELGCHWGFDMIHWARQGFECVGVDISDSLIEKGKEKLSKEPEEVQKRVKFIQGWIEEFKTEEKYETVVLTETLEHVIDPLPIMLSARECLSKDGLIYISAPNTRCGNFSHVRGISHVYMEELINKSGLTVVEWVNLPGKTTVIAKL